MNRSESTFCSSFINYGNNDDWIKQLVLTVGKPLSICQTSDRRYIYSLWVRYIRTISVYVIFMVYSDDIHIRYIYGFYFPSKKLSFIPRIYLKYNVRKGMVGRSEDVPWTFECLVGTNISFHIWQQFLCNYFIIAKPTLLQNHYIMSKHKSNIIGWIQNRPGLLIGSAHMRAKYVSERFFFCEQRVSAWTHVFAC